MQQLAAERAKHWHQAGEPLLTLEDAQRWLSQVGCVLYTPRKLQMPCPAPSFAEAAFGSTTAELTLAQMEPAADLLQRLIANNQAVALNLLGTLGDTPDFIVSLQALPFIFTLRGDKNWKLPPGSGSAGRVSPLATRLHELPTEHGALAARDLVTHAGREVTEAAVLRSLGELWSQLRVFPQTQPAGAPALWELASARFTKQLKAGANAGVPTALSALISLYLASVITATCEEIEIFLSPFSSRSKIRDVVHGLITARQLEESVVDGKTQLFLPDSLPIFAPQARAPKPALAEGETVESLRSETETLTPGFKPRIAKFAPRAGARTGARPGARPSKPFGKPAFGDKKPFRKPFADRAASGPGDPERRPFSGGADRPPRREYTPRAEGDARPPRKPYTPRAEGDARPPRREFDGKPSFGARKSFGDKKPFDGSRPSPRRDFGGKPSFTKPWEEDKKAPRPRAAFDAAAEAGATGGHATPRYPRFDDKKPGFRKPYVPRGEGDARPPRKPWTPRAEGDARPPRREYTPRAEGDARPPRKPWTPRAEGDARPPRKAWTPRTEGDARKPFTPGAKKFGAPKAFGAKSFGGPKKFGASKFGGAKKFGGPKKYDSGKGKSRAQGAPHKPRKEGDAE